MADLASATRLRAAGHFRDAQTVRHHGFLSESLETVGQVYLAVETEFGFVAF